VADLNLLTIKPCIYAANVNESDLRNQGSDNSQLQKLKQIAATEGSNVVLVSAQVRPRCNSVNKLKYRFE